MRLLSAGTPEASRSSVMEETRFQTKCGLSGHLGEALAPAVGGPQGEERKGDTRRGHRVLPSFHTARQLVCGILFLS